MKKKDTWVWVVYRFMDENVMKGPEPKWGFRQVCGVYTSQGKATKYVNKQNKLLSPLYQYHKAPWILDK